MEGHTLTRREMPSHDVYRRRSKALRDADLAHDLPFEVACSRWLQRGNARRDLRARRVRPAAGDEDGDDDGNRDSKRPHANTAHGEVALR